ncbi:serine/threonine protein kinase [Niabella aquatica]
MIGTTLQNYYIEALLGEGGMGRVYKATDTVLGRVVAVKSLNTSLTNQPSFLERFRNEAKTLARLTHPNIAVLYNYLQNNGDYYMIMEYVEGENLDQLIKRNHTIPCHAVVPMIAQALEGLAHAHSKGVLHRDIKPANLMLTPYNTIKLMDFGIAKMSDQVKLTQVSRVIGTLEFLAPELIEGQEPSPVSDIYAMGVTMYEMLTGRLPFTGKSDYMLMQEIVKEKPALPDNWNNNIPHQLSEIVLKALEKKPADRYRTVEAFSRSLQEAFPGMKQIPPGLIEPAATAEQKLPDIQEATLLRAAAPATLLHKEHKEISATTLLDMDQVRKKKLLPVFKSKWWYAVAAALIILLFTLITFFPDTHEPESKLQNGIITDPEQIPAGNNMVEDITENKMNNDSINFILNKKKQNESQLALLQQKVINPGAASTGSKKPEQRPSAQNNGSSTSVKPGQADTKPKPQPQVTPRPDVAEAEENDPDDVASGGPITLRGRGMPVVIALRENLSKETAIEGQQITFKLLEPGMLRGEVILPKGTVLHGKIKGLGSRRMSIVFNSLNARGRTARLDRSEIGASMETVFSGKGFKTSLRGTLVP